MSLQVDAIYENGLLRPLTPLVLPERARVAITIDSTTPVPNGDAAELERQQSALDAMFSEVDQLPQSQLRDGLSGRDHDRILYGGLP